MFDELRERAYRWWYGCEHEWEMYGAEFYQDRGPMLDLSGEREIYERRYSKLTRCKKCGKRGGKRVVRIEEKNPER